MRINPIFLVLCVFALISAVFLLTEVRGPFKGWATDVYSAANYEEPAPALEPVEEPVEEPSPDEPVAEPPPAVEPNEPPPMSELELLYNDEYTKAFATMTRPTLGEQYTVKLRNKMDVEGRLDEVAAGRIKMRVEFGTMFIPVDNVHPSEYERLFPEQAAKLMAVKVVNEILKQRAAIASVPDDEPDGATEPARRPPPATGRTKYDPSPAATPEHLKDTRDMYGQWLEFQKRRVGVQFVDKIYAKEAGRNVELYMVMNEGYTVQDYDVRFSLADALWRSWSFRCQGAGLIRSMSNAHLILIDDKLKIVGGSSVHDGADVWVEK
ncbi:MAG: hypothetical protein QGF67_14675 [Lentisphaeria bacterium]|jgi:hypothetical protein|nr:hypothetical protein [Lentisphaeria bacterium]